MFDVLSRALRRIRHDKPAVFAVRRKRRRNPLQPVLVGFCPSCGFAVDPYPGRGTPCDGDNEEKDTRSYHHRYHKRRLFKCDGGCEESYFFTEAGLAAHREYYDHMESS